MESDSNVLYWIWGAHDTLAGILIILVFIVLSKLVLEYTGKFRIKK